MTDATRPDEHRKKSIREISPIDVYKLLPKTNCQECHESNCMAFATRLVNGELMMSDCPPLFTVEYQAARNDLGLLLAPPVRAVTFGTGKKQCTIGGKYVLQRHEFTYHNPTIIAIDVDDVMPEEDLRARVRRIEQFTYNYIGRRLALNAIAIRSVSGNPSAFGTAARTVAGATDLPIILCSLDSAVMEAGLLATKDNHPLIYAATEKNWKPMADLALAFHAPLVLHTDGDLALLRSLVKTLNAYGLNDLVLDPGTLAEDGLSETLHSLTAIRTAACRDFDELLGYPLLGVPLAVWTSEEISMDVLKWRETIIASLLMSRYADLLIMHSLDGWVLLPQLIWRFNLYTDPRKPVSVEAGIRTFGHPDKNSPVLITTNYALTFFTVESDIKGAGLDCYLIVVDTGGLSVESAVAGRYFSVESIVSALKDGDVRNLVNHKTLIIPGLAARLSGEAEEATGWRILVGPKDSSGLPQYLREHWPPRSD
jgi:acetyl-CoA decarbonylase/synthase, CODH/ACS complex subunit gamma